MGMELVLRMVRPSVHAGEHHVQEHQVRGHLAKHGQGVVPPVGGLDLKAFLLQVQLYQTADVGVVVHQQNIRFIFHKRLYTSLGIRILCVVISG